MREGTEREETSTGSWAWECEEAGGWSRGASKEEHTGRNKVNKRARDEKSQG